MSMRKDLNSEINTRASNVIPIRWVPDVGCKCTNCSYRCSEHNTSFCESCLSVQTVLDSYFKTRSRSEYTEIVEAIWNLQCAKMQIQHTFLMFPTQPPDDVLLTLSKLQHRLSALIASLESIKQENQLYLFLAVIARETDLMLKSKKAQWWMS